ncbi:TetR/AcrR family transcriptional regulator [Bordetella holmesii]|nr:TetR/AcrR family transcriptional regulator [Bordetella holmesii]AMD49306.1 TetR family transcriptional regulator [Bordetella holmesii F627]AUL18167.1 TetR family transcriptional regulator [Bordetella holmesii]AUL21479.1 TetR family transcriptional regulator [Bordetella holmesii]AUL24802.1 TetR family transcriptional regulator [Bordetella holmesii]AUL28140.1 TetR family transcriptional regulator [Bordetella holmesii]
MNTATSRSTDARAKILANGQRIMSGKGFAAVGINEILVAAGVPKGSFYHYFDSKDAYGEALLENYFEEYLAGLEATLTAPGQSVAERLMNYWQEWQEVQSFSGCQGKCLTVKLGAEVADLSEAMRLSLKRGSTSVIARLAQAIEEGVLEGSVAIDGKPAEVAQTLYQLWVGASVMAKIVRSTQPFESALAATRLALHLPA